MKVQRHPDMTKPWTSSIPTLTKWKYCNEWEPKVVSLKKELIFAG